MFLLCVSLCAIAKWFLNDFPLSFLYGHLAHIHFPSQSFLSFHSVSLSMNVSFLSPSFFPLFYSFSPFVFSIMFSHIFSCFSSFRFGQFPFLRCFHVCHVCVCSWAVWALYSPVYYPSMFLRYVSYYLLLFFTFPFAPFAFAFYFVSLLFFFLFYAYSF